MMQESSEAVAARVRDKITEDYWAAMPFRDEKYATAVLEIFNAHLQVICHSEFGSIMWQAYRAYHMMESSRDMVGTDTPITSVMLAGEQGELLSMELPHFRQLVLHKKNLVAGDRMAFEPQAATSDGEATRQVSTARHLLDYVMDQLGLGKGLRDSEEIALVPGASYVHLGWNPYAGDVIGTNDFTGRPIYTGDLRWNVLAPWEVAHQLTRSYKDAKWHVVREWESKFDLAARLLDRGDPETAEELLNYSHTVDDYQFVLPDSGRGPGSEVVPVYYVYHDRTPSVPNGRMSIITADGLFVDDRELPYPMAPIERNCPNEMLGSPIPFSSSWGWLAIQEQLNAVMSSMVTRVDAGAHPMVSVPEGSDWSTMGPYQYHERAEGQEPPMLVELSQMSPALPGMYQLLLGESQRLSGINSVVQGQPQESVSSGSFAALIHAQAITFANDDVESYVTCAERVATKVLQVYQARASEPMLIAIAGESGASGYKEFKGEAIKSIKRVVVKRGNPLTKTTGARQELATALLTSGAPITPEQFITVAETGSLDSIMDGPARKMAVIAKENAMILDGKVPVVGDFEPFHLHVREHSEIEDEYLKENQAAQGALRKHMSETFAKWQKQSMENPGALQALGIPLLPPTPAMIAQAQAAGIPIPQQPQGGEAQKPPQKPGPKPAPQARGVDNRAKMAKPVRMPSMPTPPEGAE